MKGICGCRRNISSMSLIYAQRKKKIGCKKGEETIISVLLLITLIYSDQPQLKPLTGEVNYRIISIQWNLSKGRYIRQLVNSQFFTSMCWRQEKRASVSERL